MVVLEIAATKELALVVVILVLIVIGTLVLAFGKSNALQLVI